MTRIRFAVDIEIDIRNIRAHYQKHIVNMMLSYTIQTMLCLYSQSTLLAVSSVPNPASW